MMLMEQDCKQHEFQAVEGNYVCIRCGNVSNERVLATDFSTGSELAALRNASNTEHNKNPLALFNTLNGLSFEKRAIIPRHLAKSQQSASKHADHKDQIKAALKRDVMDTTLALCTELGLHGAQFTIPIYRLAYTFLCRVLADRLKDKEKRVEAMKDKLKIERYRCSVCAKMPPSHHECWTRHSQTNKGGRLCNDCDDEEVQYPRPNVSERQMKIFKYETRLPAISLAKVSVVAACLFIEAERMFHRFRIGEICVAMEHLGCGKQKETVKKWVARVRVVAKIQAVPLVDRVAGFACRLLQQYYRSSDPRVDEQERADLCLMTRGVLYAETQLKSKKKEEKQKPTVQRVDGLLNSCLLNARLKPPEANKQVKHNVLGGHSERLVAAVLVYLRLRLRGDPNNKTTILEHRQRAGVDMQAFQACKSYVIRLIDPALWE